LASMLCLREALPSSSSTSGLGVPMPAAKKSAARTPSTRSRAGTPPARSSSRTPASRATATRREAERQIARFEKHLDDASEALQLLGKDLGRGAQDAYKDVTKAMQALRRDAKKTNRNVLKDFDKLRAAVTPTRSPRRSSTQAAARSDGTSSATRSSRSTNATRARSSRSTAKRSAGSGGRK
jgi:hypothetical protein